MDSARAPAAHRPCPQAQASSLTLPPELDSPAAARSLVRDVLTCAGLTEHVEAAELAVTELVTNAALHARTPITVTITLTVPDDGPHGGPLVRVEVADGSPELPGPRGYDAQATTGRGLALVGALTSGHGIVTLPDGGKAMWFELDSASGQQSDADLLAAWDDTSWELDDTDVAAPQDGERTRVLLPSLPALLWLSTRQHHDALLRELVLYLAEHHDVEVDLALAGTARGAITSAVRAAVEQAQRTGEARPVLPAGHPSPLPWVPQELDLELEVRSDVGPAYAALQDALDAAERLAVQGRLLVRPGLPEVVAVRDWVCEQVQSQLAGVAPSPWGGTAQASFETHAHRPEQEPTWDLSAALASGRGMVAADDANRIVDISPGLAATLGWDPADLRGRRVVTLIPGRLREGHVAGFTRHLTTGEAHVLGVALTLPVLRTDGSEVDCRFLVEQAAQQAGRALYLAWIEPVEA